MNQKIHLMTTRCKIETTWYPPCNFACEERKPFGGQYGFGHEGGKTTKWQLCCFGHKALGGC